MFLWPVPLVLLALSKPRAVRRRWWALAGAGLAVWIGIGATSQKSSKTTTVSASNPVIAASPTKTSAATTSGAPLWTTTTSMDPDAVADPAAAGAKPPPAAGTVAVASSPSCRTGNPLANVYHPDRLQVIKPCITVTGLVSAVRHEADGDIHINVDLDPAYGSLINDRNVSGEQGALVTELVLADEPGCTPGQPPRPPSGSYDYGICTGTNETAPPIGERVAVTGPYVLDTDHGWMEIHPVWSLSAETQATSPSPPETSTSMSAAPPSAGVRITSVTSPVSPGQTASLAAQTSANSGCSLAVTLPSGSQSTSQGLGPKTADSSGAVTWSWKIGTRTGAGTATATVSCGSSTDQTQFQVS